jgi:alpha-glucosidase (family GH31 glycosyl hydrolase)
VYKKVKRANERTGTMNNIPKQYKFEAYPKADPRAIVAGEKYRFTVLTPYFIRMEYNEEGFFEDRPTKIVWNRFQPVPEYEVTIEGEELSIITAHLQLQYTIGQPFARGTLMIKTVTNAIHGSGVWRYGFRSEFNRKGTYRTLDGVDGGIPLDDGLFSEEGYTIIDDSHSLVFTEEGWFEKRPEGTVDLYYFGYGNAFREGLRDYYLISGKTPILPRYALGNWWSRYWDYNDEELIDLMDTFEAKDIPLSVCIVDMDWHETDIDEKYGSGWTGYTWNRKLFNNPKTFMDGLHDRGLVTSLNLHPALGFRGHEACYESFAKFMGMDPNKEELIEFDPVNPKFMEGYFTYGHHPHEADGVDFWWIDWQQGNNTKVEGIDPLFLLNHYHFMDHGRHEDIRPFIFSRWSGFGSHKYPIGFSGDTVITWDSLQFQPEFTLTAANAGYGWWSHDIGGHYNGTEEDELYTRWVQLGVFSPIMRLHSSKNYYSRREPWRYTAATEATVKKYMKLRHKLLPYLYTVNKQHSEGGLPLITPMYYHYPNHYGANFIKDSYMFGEFIMVAPFLEKTNPILKLAKRKVWFPEGQWFDFLTGRLYEGDKEVTIYGSIEDTPVYVKAGGIIPLAVLESGHGVANPKEIRFRVYPGKDGQYCLYEDDGVSQKYRKGQSLETNINVSYEKVDGQQTKMSISISLKGEKTVAPQDRIYSVELCGFKLPQEVIGTSLASDTKNIVTMTPDSEGKMHVELYFEGNPTKVSYDPTHEIMEVVERSEYELAHKSWIGYNHKKYAGSRGGVLGEECPVLDKIQKIMALDIPTDLKDYVVAELAKTRI